MPQTRQVIGRAGTALAVIGLAIETKNLYQGITHGDSLQVSASSTYLVYGGINIYVGMKQGTGSLASGLAILGVTAEVSRIAYANAKEVESAFLRKNSNSALCGVLYADAKHRNNRMKGLGRTLQTLLPQLQFGP